uniref:Ig-like domain-containing protein n=1 Tax=Paramormyrops kingsleyae TaxID=1676925 RepID=A0A3B3QCV9_9TELE
MGDPCPTITWFHDDVCLNTAVTKYRFESQDKLYRLYINDFSYLDVGTYKLKDEYTLIITQVKAKYAGQYSCTATNKFGQSTCTTFLYNVKSTEGGQTYFYYKVTGNPRPEVTWFKGSYQILPSDHCIMLNNPDGSGFLNLKDLQVEDSGLYTCQASNPSGYTSCSCSYVICFLTCYALVLYVAGIFNIYIFCNFCRSFPTSLYY